MGRGKRGHKPGDGRDLSAASPRKSPPPGKKSQAAQGLSHHLSAPSSRWSPPRRADGARSAGGQPTRSDSAARTAVESTREASTPDPSHWWQAKAPLPPPMGGEPSY